MTMMNLLITVIILSCSNILFLLIGYFAGKGNEIKIPQFNADKYFVRKDEEEFVKEKLEEMQEKQIDKTAYHVYDNKKEWKEEQDNV